MKIMPTALLLCLSLGAYAQDEDLTEGVVAEGEEVAEVFVPTTPTEKKFFQRVQLGFQGTNVKYTNFGYSPDYNNYFLKGISLGWMGDAKIAKKYPIYFEIGATLAYHMGACKGDTIVPYHPWGSSEGSEHVFHYDIKAFTVTIPVNVSYQFRNFLGVQNLTVAPYAGVYFRFNAMVKRKATDTYKEYIYNEDGSRTLVPGSEKTTHYTASLMKTDAGPDQTNYPEIDPKSRFCMRGIVDKPHVGTLCQPGAQVGVNVFYKNFSFGAAYMRDLKPFSSHTSSSELTSKETKEGGNLPNIGTGCDEKISTANNFAVTVGYIF